MTDTPNPTPTPLGPLLELLLDGSLSATQWMQLRELLATDPAAAERYIDFVTIHALLESELEWHGALQTHGFGSEAHGIEDAPPSSAGAARIAAADQPRPPSPAWEQARKLAEQARRRPRAWVIRGMAAAIIVLATSLAWIIFGHKTPQVASGPGSTGTHGLTPTTSQATGLPVTLPSGFARFTLANGVDLLIEAPAEYEILGASRLRLNSGRLTAVVPHSAVGFTVETKEAKITDLGTEFGVIAGNGFTETEVFDGRVAVEPQVAESVHQVLSIRQANRVDAGGRMESAEADPALFVQVRDFDRSDPTRVVAAAFERWSAFSHRLRRWPGLVAYYDFESGSSSDVLADVSGNAHDGRLGTGQKYTLPKWTTGRWPRKHGLLFDSEQLQGVVIPNATAFNDLTKSITIAAWIKPHPANRDVAGAIIAKLDTVKRKTFDFSCAYRDAPAAHWSLYFGGAEVPTGGGRRTGSILPRDRGWMFLAVTSQPGGQTRFYVNGRLASALPAASHIFPTSADVFIGCADWVYNHNFNGIMDELALFNRPLSDAEIGDIYQAGKPQ